MKHSYLKLEFDAKRQKSSKSKNNTAKIWDLFAENKNSDSFQNNELELIGITDMVNGLEYHYAKMVRIEATERKYIKKTMQEMIHYKIPKNMIHEATAYLNRLGQIETLITSDWFKKNIKDEDLALLCSKILALIPFRNKFTAHRSLDDDRFETDSQKENHATLPLITKWYGSHTSIGLKDLNYDNMNIAYTIKISRESKHGRSKILKKHHPEEVNEFEIFTEQEIFIFFIPVKQHEQICLEILGIVKKFLTHEK